MSSSNTLTYDATTPHRPALSELGGGGKLNSVKRPPDPATMATAEDFNQFSKQLSALGKVIPLVRLWVRISAGTPSIINCQALGTNVLAGDFTLIDNAAGDTTIWWTTGSGGKLPDYVGGTVSQTDDVEIDRIRCFNTTGPGGQPAVRIKTKLGAAGTDCNFVVEIS